MVSDGDADVLYLVIRFLRSLGLSRSVIALLEETGLDPTWLCGPSTEIAVLREWVFNGEWERVRAFLLPLEKVLEADRFEAAIRRIEKQATMEEIFDPVTPADRRRVIWRGFQSGLGRPDRLTRPEQLMCLQALETSPLVRIGWDQDKGRLECFEALVPLFRDPMKEDDEESVLENMKDRQLVGLLNDAMMHHRQESCGLDSAHLNYASVTPVCSNQPAKSAFGSSLILDPEARPRMKETVQGAENLSASVDWSRLRLSGYAHEYDRRAEPLKKMKHNPLVVSVAFRKETLSPGQSQGCQSPLCEASSVEEEVDETRVLYTEDSIEAGCQTDPINIIQFEAFTQTTEQSTSSGSEKLLDAPRDNQSDGDFDQSAKQECSEMWSSVRQEHNSAQKLTSTAKSVEQRPAVDLVARHRRCSAGSDYECRGLEPTMHDPETPDPDPLVCDSELSEPPQHGEIPIEYNGAEQGEDGDQHLVSYNQLTLELTTRARVIAEVKEVQAARAIDIAPDGSEMVIGTNARALRVFDLHDVLVQSTMPSHGQSTFLPLLPVAMEKHKHHTSSIYCVAFSQTSTSRSHPLIASGAAESSIKVISRWTQEETWIRGHSGKCRSLRFLSENLLCSAASGDLVVRCWDLQSSNASCVRRFDGHAGEIQSMTTMPMQAHDKDSETVFVTTSMDRTTRLWDFRSAQCVRVVTRTASPAFAVACRDQYVLATGHQDGTVALWDLRSSRSRPLTNLAHHRDECRAVSWSPCGSWLLSAGLDGTVCIMETALGTASLQPVASFQQHQDKVLQAQWHPTQPAFVTTGADKTVKTWAFH